jgi:hypothetical protein
LKAATSDDDDHHRHVHRVVLQGPQLQAVKHQQESAKFSNTPT